MLRAVTEDIAKLSEASVVATLEAVLAETGLDPAFLELEITETSAMHDPDGAIAIVGLLKEMGLSTAIDDFGTGASTLSEFRTLPVDTVKIDKSFLARHGGTDIDTDGEVVLSGIVAMAHELKRAVVAEGIESESDAQFLSRIGCEFGQGYYFSAALDGPAVLEYIARHYNTATAPELG